MRARKTLQFDVAGVVTLAGSIARKDDLPAAVDATAVARLRRDGALLLGATNMDEGAYGFTTASDAGTVDAGSADAGHPDAGPGDAGSGGGPDAGSDGGAGGSVDPPAGDITGSCSSSSENAPSLVLAVLAALAARRRSVNS